MNELYSSPKHVLTDQYIALVGGGMSPFDAGMSLVGPLLPLAFVQNQIFDWETDLEVCQRVEALVSERLHMTQRVRETTVERLLAVITQDVRKYFRQVSTGEEGGALKVEVIPITLWTKSMASAVKKLKYAQKTDPFGNTTDTIQLEFYNPHEAITEMRVLAPEVFEVVQLSSQDKAIDTVMLDKLTDAELDALHAKLLKAI